MNSGAIKEKTNIPSFFGRYFLALVFLSAGIFRIIFPASASQELINLDLPPVLSWFIVAVEISAGLLLIINKYIKQVYLSLIIFLSLALIWALIISGAGIISLLGELFVFNLTPTDFFLHIIFLGLAVFLLKAIKKDKVV